MKDLAPYAIVAFVCLALGAMLMKQCSTPEVIVRNTVDTLRVTEWQVVDKWQTKTIVKRDTVSRIEYQTVDCCPKLDNCLEELWTMANLEVEAEQRLDDGGLARVGFSMPIYSQSPDKAFRLYVERPRTDSVRVEHAVSPRSWYQRFGYGPQVGVGYPLGWYAGVGIHYDLSGMF